MSLRRIRLPRLAPALVSLALHATAIALLLSPAREPLKRAPIPIAIHRPEPSPTRLPSRPRKPGKHSTHAGSPASPHLRLGLPMLSSPQPTLGDSPHPTSEFLVTDSNTWAVFDLLALKIHRHLDYPDQLVSNGIHGQATLDLYFDAQGQIDERKSGTSGTHRALRGLLVRAARKGLVQWYASDAGRLLKEQFKNQHFRADFILSYSGGDNGEFQRLGPGSYGFLRKHASNALCIGEAAGSPVINLTCVAAGIGGALWRSVSDEAKSQFTALLEQLDDYDSIGLEGINALTRSES